MSKAIEISKALVGMAWAYLQGKKSAIAASANALLMWAVISNKIDDNTAVLLASLLTAWTGVAVTSNMKKGGWVPVVLLSVLLIGCGKKTTTIDMLPPPPAPAVVETPIGMWPDEPAQECNEFTGVVHFDFDQSELRTEDVPVVYEAATAMQCPETQAILTGHACPIGTEEYNMGLGFRRARAVESALLASGVESRRIEVVSKGEYLPLTRNPEKFSHNRRCEITILSTRRGIP